MIESLWSCLLILSALNRQTRPLALVLAAKAVLNYSTAGAGLWLMPPVIDLAAGAVGIMLALRLSIPWLRSLLVVSFVLTPLIHAWHWGLWSSGVYVGVQYWLILLGLFTAQTLALSLPEVQDCVRAYRRHRRLTRRRGLAGVDSSGRGGGASRRG